MKRDSLFGLGLLMLVLMWGNSLNAATPGNEIEAAIRLADSKDKIRLLTNEALEEIKGAESTEHSQALLDLHDFLSAKDIGSAEIVQRALETGNKDLLDFAAKEIERAEFDKNTEWRKSVAIRSKISSAISALGIWNHERSHRFLEDFKNSPEVPFKEVTDWDMAMAIGGCQEYLPR